MKRCLTLLLLTVTCALGCGSGERPAPAVASSERSAAEKLWRSKCGSCHVPVEPGTRGRDAIEAAVGRHRARLALTTEQWQQLVEFLAPSKP